jgi:hypothetical protein
LLTNNHTQQKPRTPSESDGSAESKENRGGEWSGVEESGEEQQQQQEKGGEEVSNAYPGNTRIQIPMT